jgi:hypothetical protein
MSILRARAASLIEANPKQGTAGAPPLGPFRRPRRIAARETPKARAAAAIETYVTPSISIGFAFW